MFAVGQVVFSKQGRDKGRAFIVFEEQGDYVHLVDGKLRPLSNPKKKKLKHVQPTYHVDYSLAERIEAKGYLNDADIKKALVKFQV